ncbi:MAG TPA: CsgG/HfaB family protein [Spirochaetota bacterium]|nr:CsgG/HfaB family protein [Spirochaetota bacterium]
MRKIAIIAVIIAGLTASCTTFEKDLYFKTTKGFKKNIRVALIPFEDASGVANSGVNVSDAITNELIKIREWDIVERTQISKIIREQAFEATGMTEKDYAKLGKIANVDYFITGSLGQYDCYVDKKNEARIRITINIRFIDTVTGKVIGTGRYVYNTNKNYLRSCCLVSWVFMLMPEDTIDKELTKVAKAIVQDMKEHLELEIPRTEEQK